jgi:CRP-like cAMP-binding protein
MARTDGGEVSVPTLEQQATFLSRVPLFVGIERRFIEVLAGIMQLAAKPAGTVLCKQGDPADACFIIGRGQVEILVGDAGHERAVAVLGAGRIVGDVALIDGKRRSATARCQTDVTLFTFRRDDFDRLLHAANPASMRLLDNLVRELASRVRGVNEQLTAVFAQADATAAALVERLRPVRSAGEAGPAGEGGEIE